ncbi:MAG: hypothetical protein ACI87E_002016 [Mariniblastus sp.]|jgi:hypothetical protein
MIRLLDQYFALVWELPVGGPISEFSWFASFIKSDEEGFGFVQTELKYAKGFVEEKIRVSDRSGF